jgi:Phage tail tube protein
MAYTNTILRGERFKLAFAPESTYGTDPGTGLYTNVFGVVQSATLPDPLVDITPIYAMGSASNRNWYVAYRGRLSLSGSIPDIWLLDGRMLYLGIGYPVTTGGPTYTHTINESTALRSFAIHASLLDSAGNVALMRRWLGGKCNRMTISAAEGDFVKVSMDDMQFINTLNDQVGENFYNAGIADITPTYPTTEPYIFSYGTMSLNGNTFARLRDFKIEISNNLDAKYYVTNQAVSRLPYEHREGKREYRMGCNIDVADSTLFKELVRMGTYSSVYKGFQVIITFTRATGDTITITTPATAPGAGGDAMGCLIRSAPYNIVDAPVVTVPLDIMMRNLSVVVQDSISAYPGE